MRIGQFEIDPFVLVLAIATSGIGLMVGLGPWAFAAGLAVPLAAGGSHRLALSLAPWFASPPSGTRERQVVLRARRAAVTMTRLQMVRPGPISKRSREISRQAYAALPTIVDLAFQAFRVRSLAEAIPADRLELERARTTGLIEATTEERLRVEFASELRSTEAQLRTASRLNALSDELHARAGALAASMEALAAGLAELHALTVADSTGQPQAALSNLSREIEALRGGLEEAQTFGRSVAAIHLEG